jgi:hypothetical protein
MAFTVNRYEVSKELRSDAEDRIAVLKSILDEAGTEEEEERLSDEVAGLLAAFNYVQDGQNWAHIDLENEGNAFDDFCFGPETNLIADSYFSESRLQSRLLDWFLVDGLIASLYKKVRFELMRLATPKLYELTTVSRSKMYWLIGWYALSFVAKWALLLVLVGGTFALGFEHRAWFFVSAFLIFVVIYRRRIKGKALEPFVKDLLHKVGLIKRVYTLTSTPNIDWQVLKNELDETRRQGIEWPSALYAAVRRRGGELGQRVL